MINNNDNIDTITKFLDDVRKLGNQLSITRDEQKEVLAQMLSLKKDDRTKTEEYIQLETRSKDLQAILDKYSPIFNERMKWIKDIKAKHPKKR
jgi:septal ring factor EnvC (AmiA/AmiB activator)